MNREFDIKEIEKTSFKIFMVLFLVSMVISIFFHTFSIALGFLLGYLLNLFVFRIIQVEADALLVSYGKLTISLVVVLGLAKLAVYALGFILAIKFPNILHLIGVFFGYFVIKLTIFYMGYRMRKE